MRNTERMKAAWKSPCLELRSHVSGTQEVLDQFLGTQHR
jgi:hypothetical protein